MGEHNQTVLDKIHPFLKTDLDAQPAEERAVIVYFHGRVEQDTLKSLGLRPMVEDAARGDMDRAGVLRLAARADVRRIEAVPEERPRG